MTGTVYLNGAFVPEDEACVPVMDRGLLFADAVYEGIGVLDGHPIDLDRHLGRLRRSLAALGIPEPLTPGEWWDVARELIRRSGLDEASLYLQVSRGTARRDFAVPEDLAPNVFAFVLANRGPGADDPPSGLRLGSTRDLRWARRDVKTTNLLAQVLAKQEAAESGFDEALLVGDDGTVTECASRSFFCVIDGALVIRPLSAHILHGVTRRAVLERAEELGMTIVERAITLAEAYAADEAFATASSSHVEPVVAIDGHPIGDGTPGPVTMRLRAAYLAHVRAAAHTPTPDL